MNLKSTISSFAAIFFLLVWTNLSVAAELKIKPGLWKTKTTMTNSMVNQSQTHEETECITDEKAKLDPSTMLKDMGKECKMLDSRVENNTLYYKLSCMTEAGELSGEGHVTSHMTSAQGEFNMSMNLMGQKMTMGMSFETNRVGECKSDKKS